MCTPSLLGTRWAQYGLEFHGTGKNKKNKQETEVSQRNLAEVIPPKLWSNVGKPDSKMKDRQRGTRPTFSLLVWQNPPRSKTTSWVCFCLDQINLRCSLTRSRKSQVLRRGAQAPLAVPARSHLFQALLNPVKCSACYDGLIAWKRAGPNSHFSPIASWREVASPVLGLGACQRRWTPNNVNGYINKTKSAIKMLTAARQWCAQLLHSLTQK